MKPKNWNVVSLEEPVSPSVEGTGSLVVPIIIAIAVIALTPSPAY